MFPDKSGRIKGVLEIIWCMCLLYVREETLAHLLDLVLSAIYIFRLVILDEVVLRKPAKDHLITYRPWWFFGWIFGWILAALVAEINELIRVLGQMLRRFSDMIAQLICKRLFRLGQECIFVVNSNNILNEFLMLDFFFMFSVLVILNLMIIFSLFVTLNFFIFRGLMIFIVILRVIKLALMTCYHLHFSRGDLNLKIFVLNELNSFCWCTLPFGVDWKIGAVFLGWFCSFVGWR